ncbi:MAG: hypothetical protein J6J04_05785 [Oscillospiraceae bacterium]|nr:hypothetical protein [Oscillospiraceae bacterium]
MGSLEKGTGASPVPVQFTCVAAETALAAVRNATKDMKFILQKLQFMNILCHDIVTKILPFNGFEHFQHSFQH